MKYLKKVLISLLLIVFLTGCFGGSKSKVLSCTMTDVEDDGIRSDVSYDIFANGDTVTGTTMEMKITLPDDTENVDMMLDFFESMYDQFEEEEGLTFTSTRQKNGITILIEYDFEVMDPNSTEYANMSAGLVTAEHVSDVRAELEEEGFTCK